MAIGMSFKLEGVAKNQRMGSYLLLARIDKAMLVILNTASCIEPLVFSPH
jgi:hypothetical protein